MAATARYLYVGMIILAVSGAIAIYLYFEGIRCLTVLSQLDVIVIPPNQIEELEVSCAITTNSYVYSIYGLIAGIILVVVGFMKKRRGNSS